MKRQSHLSGKLRKQRELAYGADAAKIHLPLKTDEETGQLLFNAKTKFAPKFVDSEGVLLNPANVPNVYSGSTIRMYVKLEPTNAQGKTT